MADAPEVTQNENPQEEITAKNEVSQNGNPQEVMTAKNEVSQEEMAAKNEVSQNAHPQEEMTVKNEQEETVEEPRADTIFDEDNHKESLAEINFDLIDTGRWLLKVVAGPNNGAEFSMHASSSYVIGTDPNSCDIIFHDTSVSRQHARISIDAQDGMMIEDLKSRNGTLIDGETIKTKKKLTPNAVATMGTTAFVVYDREGEMQTIISPLLPSIVKVLQNEEPQKTEAVTAPPPPPSVAPVAIEEDLPIPEVKHEKSANALAAFIVMGILTGLFVIVGLGTATLFKSEPVVMEQPVDTTQALDDAMKPFPNVKTYFNKSTGKVQLIGHVLTASDKNQLLYTLQGLKFVKEIDDSGVIIDEYVWQEINQVLAKTPIWKGISVHSPAPGKFILSGYLQTRKQAEQLSDYLTGNFQYLDLLEKRIVVEEDVINNVTNILHTAGLRDIVVQMSNGELTLTGGVPPAKKGELQENIEEIKKIPGIRNVKNFIVDLAAEQSIINISDKYEVTGVSHRGNTYSVVVQGRILTNGDVLDGMTIKEIRANAIFLEKDGVHYRIDFSK